MADDSGAVIDHPLPRTMQRLNILLFDALLWDEGNVGLTCGRTSMVRISRFAFCRVDAPACSKRFQVLHQRIPFGVGQTGANDAIR